MIRTQLETERLRLRLFNYEDIQIRVAEKLGMAKGPLIHVYGEDALQYEMML